MAVGGPTLGSVFVEIGGDASPFVDDFNKALSGAEAQAGSAFGKMSTAMNDYGSRVLGALGTAFKRGGQALGAALAVSVGLGLKRLVGIEEARAKLQGLGHDAQAVDAIMENALQSVLGTAFGLEKAATIAASAVAAGVKPGKDLERTLKLTADAATIAGRDLDDMGAIFNKVAAGGRMTGQELQQLTNAGIPMLQWLAEEFGVTAEAAREMVKDGAVSFELFQKLIEDNIGGAALKSAETTMGAFKNMGAAAGRFGAVLAGPVFRQARTVFLGIIGLLDRMTKAITPMMEAFEARLVPAVANAGHWLEVFGEGLRGVHESVGPLAHEMVGAAGRAREFGMMVRTAFMWVTGAVRTVVGWYRTHEDTIRALVRAVVPAVAIVSALAAGMAAVSAVLAGFGAVVASPILLLMGLATALVYAYQNTERFKEVLDGLLASVREVGGGVFDSLREGISSFTEQLANGAGVLEAFGSAWETFTAGLRSRDVFGQLREMFFDLLAWLTSDDGIPSILTFMVESKLKFVESAITMLSGIIEGIAKVLPDIVDAIARAIPQILAALVAATPLVVEASVKLLTGLVTAVAEILPVVVYAVVDLVTQLIGALLEQLPVLIDAGVTLLMGLAESVAVAIPAIVDALTFAFPLIVNAIVDALPLLIDAGLTLFLGLVDAITTALPPIVTALTEAIPVILQALVDALPDLIDAGIQLLLGLIDAITIAMPQIVDALVAAIPDITGALIEAMPLLVEAGILLFLGLVEAITQALPAITDAIIDMAPELVAAVLQLIPELLVAGVQLFWALAQAVDDAIPEIFAALDRLGRSLLTWFGGLPAQIEEAVWDLVDRMATWATESLTAAWKAFRRVFGNAPADSILGWFKTLPGKLVSVLTGLPGLLIGWARESFTKGWQQFQQTFNLMLAWFRGLPTRVVQAVSRLVTMLTTWGRNVMSGARRGIVDRWVSIRDWFRGLPQRIRNAIPNPSEILRNTGARIMGGLATGIRNAVTTVTGAVSGALVRVRRLLPSSPAQEGPFSGRGWTLYSGRSMMEALARGISDAESKAMSSLRQVAANLASVPMEAAEFPVGPTVTGASRVGQREPQTVPADSIAAMVSKLGGGREAPQLTVNVYGTEPAPTARHAVRELRALSVLYAPFDVTAPRQPLEVNRHD